jgi:hypothetical protein
MRQPFPNTSAHCGALHLWRSLHAIAARAHAGNGEERGSAPTGARQCGKAWQARRGRTSAPDSAPNRAQPFLPPWCRPGGAAPGPPSHGLERRLRNAVGAVKAGRRGIKTHPLPTTPGQGTRSRMTFQGLPGASENCSDPLTFSWQRQNPSEYRRSARPATCWKRAVPGISAGILASHLDVRGRVGARRQPHGRPGGARRRLPVHLDARCGVCDGPRECAKGMCQGDGRWECCPGDARRARLGDILGKRSAWPRRVR